MEIKITCRRFVFDSVKDSVRKRCDFVSFFTTSFAFLLFRFHLYGFFSICTISFPSFRFLLVFLRRKFPNVSIESMYIHANVVAGTEIFLRVVNHDNLGTRFPKPKRFFFLSLHRKFGGKFSRKFQTLYLRA